jgi:hypothetical protein
MQPLHDGWKRSFRPDAGRADHLALLFDLIATGGNGSADALRERAFTFDLVS